MRTRTLLAIAALALAGCGPSCGEAALADAEVVFKQFRLEVTDDVLEVRARFSAEGCPQLNPLVATANGVPMALTLGGPREDLDWYRGTVVQSCVDSFLSLRVDLAGEGRSKWGRGVTIDLLDASGSVIVAASGDLMQRPLRPGSPLDLEAFELAFEPGPVPANVKPNSPLPRASALGGRCLLAPGPAPEVARGACARSARAAPRGSLSLAWQTPLAFRCTRARCGSEVEVPSADPRGSGAFLAFDLTGLELTRRESTWISVFHFPALDFRALWGSGPDDLWAVGGFVPPSGTSQSGPNAVHWNGAGWQYFTGGSPDAWGLPRRLTGVWGSGPRDVWLVGTGGTLLRWNGSELKQVSSGTTEDLGAVWGSGPYDVWVAGTKRLLHYDGTGWKDVPGVQAPGSCPRCGLYGSSWNDVWLVGTETDGQPAPSLHWDGTAWTPVRAVQATGAAGTGAADVWFWGGGAPLRWDGRSVSAPAALDEVGETSGLWAAGKEEVWAVQPDYNHQTHDFVGNVARWRGVAWTWSAPLEITSQEAFYRSGTHAAVVWGSSPTDIWIAGTNGHIWRGPGPRP